MECRPLKSLIRAALLAVICAFSSVFAQVNIVVNNVGYEKSGTKRAVVQSSGTVSATTFDLINASGSAVMSSVPLGASATVDSWSGDGFRYFKAADFSSYATAGDGYRVRVGTVTSPPFAIGEKILQTKTGADQVAFFNKMRNTDEDDRELPIFGTTPTKTHNLYGGWWDATGDPGKHLSHLTYSNYFTPQQIPLVVWALLHANELQPGAFGASARSEAAWGADYLLRSLSSEGFFYLSVFDNWGDGYTYVKEERHGSGTRGGREICNWGNLEGIVDGNSDGIRSGSYQAAMREGGGVSIAALARAYKANISGDSGAARYLAGAERAYAHLKANPTRYQDDGKENIIDDYTGLLAATELFLATDNEQYRSDARDRIASLVARQSPEGWFYSGKDNNGQNTRPFYHAADEGFPVVALSRYYQAAASPDEKMGLRMAIRKNLLSYHNMTYQSSNPFEYAKMYGAPGATNPGGAANAARGGTASASRSEGSFTPDKAFDGNTSSNDSRWSSYENGAENNNQWLAVDLGSVYNVSEVVIYWEAAYGKNYRIEVSTNGTSWTTAATITNNSAGGKQTHSFTPRAARHVRMFGVERGIDYGGFSIYEFEVYGEQEQPPVTQANSRFFIPKTNETDYWWQGENARLASMASAFIFGAPMADSIGAIAGTMWRDTLFTMASAQLDWILGRNPLNLCMMYGYSPSGGDEYPNYQATRVIPNIKGGICNGISSARANENNIEFAPFKGTSEEDAFWQNWRYIEQWLPHNAWYLIAVSSLSYRIENPIAPEEVISVKYAASAPKPRFKISTRNRAVRVGLPSNADNHTEIVIYNIQGRTIYKHKVQPNTRIVTMNLPKNMAKGAYVLSVRDATGKSRGAGRVYLK